MTATSLFTYFSRAIFMIHSCYVIHLSFVIDNDKCQKCIDEKIALRSSFTYNTFVCDTIYVIIILKEQITLF